jgi:hypothetical protein
VESHSKRQAFHARLDKQDRQMKSLQPMHGTSFLDYNFNSVQSWTLTQLIDNEQLKDETLGLGFRGGGCVWSVVVRNLKYTQIPISIAISASAQTSEHTHSNARR